MNLILEKLPPYNPTAIQFPPVEFMSDQELLEHVGKEFIFDIECFSNFFCIVFKSLETDKVLYFELSDYEKINIQKLYWIIFNCTLTGFNNNNYDNPILWACLEGFSNEKLKEISQHLVTETPIWKIEKEFKFKVKKMNSIDLMEVAPSAATFCSLKHYGARMHSPIIQDLPIHHSEEIQPNDFMKIRLYCINDTSVTKELRQRLNSAIVLRESMGRAYRLDVRSLSDAQISERVIGEEISASTGTKIERVHIKAGTEYQYQVPAYMQFYTPDLQNLLEKIKNTIFAVDQHGKIKIKNGDIYKSATNEWKVKIGKSSYRLGIGGIHSEESKKSYFADSNNLIIDRDVESYYPKIILNQRLFPRHIGEPFLRTYKDIVDRRINAKKNGDKTTADSLKITINGCFGKLGSKWSIFYSPDLLIQVTLSGQLSLLMLIEMLEWIGISVVSANTDGIVFLCPQDRAGDVQSVVRDWEAITNFRTEETQYKSIHSRDVNNYIAVTLDGKIKAKGAYVNELSMKEANRESLMKNPNGTIITIAVMEHLKTFNDPHPKTIEQIITECKDVNKFIFVRRVNGGAIKDGKEIGKIVRWYMRKNEYGLIKYKEANAAGSINMVAETMGAFPIMDNRVFPKDIDYDYYIKKAHSILAEIGFYGNNYEQGLLF